MSVSDDDLSPVDDMARTLRFYLDLRLGVRITPEASVNLIEAILDAHATVHTFRFQVGHITNQIPAELQQHATAARLRLGTEVASQAPVECLTPPNKVKDAINVDYQVGVITLGKAKK